MNRIALDLGVIQIYWYSIFMFLALLAGSIVVYKEFKKTKVDEEFFINLAFNVIIFGVIGARAYYVLFNLDYYLANPIEIFKVWNGGLAIHGGIISGLLFVIYYCKKHKVNIIDILDIIVVGLIIAQAIGRWGNFFNCEAYGGVTTYDDLLYQGIPKFVIDGMYIMGAYRQPTFFYESLWCFFGFLAMIIIRKLSKTLKKGQLTGFYLIWYGIARIVIEALRTDSLMIGPIKMAQLVSVIFIGVGIYLFVRNNRKQEEKYLYKYVEPKEAPAIVYFK